MICHVWIGKQETIFTMNYCRFLGYISVFKRIHKHLKILRSPIIKKCRFSTNQEKHDLKDFSPENIRNFSIIAHIDHGKSTLADRILEITGAIATCAKNEQVLDKLQVERERGITVKAQTASLFHSYKGKTYLLNLIDTPGHVDFSYEVSRSISACQGVILLVDANQGIQAQTVANFYLAFANNLTIIPVLNKVDLKNAKPDQVTQQIKNVFEMEPETVLRISAKYGDGVTQLLDAIVERIPPPKAETSKPFSAAMFDSWYERYNGVIALIAVRSGCVKVGDHITSAMTKKSYQVKHIGIMRPDQTPVDALYCGQIGFIAANIRKISEALIGDVFYLKDSKLEYVPELKAAKPMVFAGVYAMNQTETPLLRNAIEKLLLNDPSVTSTLDSSPALGQGWRLGFLGLLHMDVFNQRLDQEYDAQVVITAPNVPYKIRLKGEKNIKKYGGELITVSNPTLLPDSSIIGEYLEPMVIGTIITPDIYVKAITSMCMEKRGKEVRASEIDRSNVMLQWKLPLSEVVINFFDDLKRLSSGYASFDYDESGYEPTSIVKMNILLNGVEVEELTTIVHKSKVEAAARQLCLKLKDTISQHQFAVAIQAVVNSKVIARETLKALRKDVAAKLYGGDRTRRMKLLQRQSEGKKRMRMIGSVQVPRDVFIRILKL